MSLRDSLDLSNLLKESFHFSAALLNVLPFLGALNTCSTGHCAIIV